MEVGQYVCTDHRQKRGEKEKYCQVLSACAEYDEGNMDVTVGNRSVRNVTGDLRVLEINYNWGKRIQKNPLRC